MKVSICLCTLLILSACTKKQNEADGALATSQVAAPNVGAGEQVYRLNCIQCHSTNPAHTGAVGPEVAGSSRELIEARILTATYPPGYKPKRETKAMPAMPYLKKDIDNLTAYLQSVK